MKEFLRSLAAQIFCLKVFCVPDRCWTTSGRHIFKQNWSWDPERFIKHFVDSCFEKCCGEGRVGGTRQVLDTTSHLRVSDLD